MSHWKKFLSILCLFFLATSSVCGQGVLVNETEVAVSLPRHIIILPPRPPRPPQPQPQPPVSPTGYVIKSLEVSAEVNGQIAEVNVSQTFTNPGSQQMEVSFVFPLPYDGAVQSMVLLVDGKEFPAKLLDAKEARKTYEDIVRRNRDPALLEWLGYGMFKTNVFPVPAGASRTVQLKYTQILKVDGGLTDFLFPMSTAKYTAKPIEKVSIHLNIETPEELKNVYSPTHEVKIKRPTSRRASISFEEANTVPDNDFRLLFDSGNGEVATRILSYRPDEKDDGYFLLLASPKIEIDKKDTLPKNVIFVIDHSPSMSGAKIVQAQEALKFVLNNLREGDRFNIVPYSDKATKYKPENIEFNDKSRAEAVAFTDSIRPSGLTNIDEALKLSFGAIQDDKMPNYVFFLTDGRPTAGERNEMKLAEIAKTANLHKARFFAFGVGFDVNARLLDRMARDNRGQTEYVKPNEDIEAHVAKLYNRISSPVLTDVTFRFLAKNSETETYGTNRVYPDGNFDLFAGEQLVVLGRYSKPGAVEIVVDGKIGADTKNYRFDGNFVEKSENQDFSFLPRLWAMRRIGEILDQLDLHANDQAAREEMIKELVDLSTKHGILTPYTSFLADESTVLTDFSGNQAAAASNVSNLSQTTGQSGVMQRSSKMAYKSASVAGRRNKAAEVAQEAEMAMNDSMPRASSTPRSSNMPRASAGGMGGGGFYGSRGNGGGGGGRGTSARSAPAGEPRIPASQLQAAVHGGAISVPAEAIQNREANVQTVNNRAFFQKGGVWIDSTLTEEQQKTENVVTVKQFSDEYFKLIEQHGKEIAPMLALGDTQLINIEGKAYRFEP